MIPSNYHREEFYHYTAEADKNIYVIMQVRSGGFGVGWGWGWIGVGLGCGSLGLGERNIITYTVTPICNCGAIA